MGISMGIGSIIKHLGLLSVSGIALALAFPEPGWGWLAHIALAPAVYLAIRSTSGKRLLWAGYLVAWVWWLVQISWLIDVTGGGYVALAAYLAVYFPAALLAIRWIHKRYHLPMVLVLPMVWVSLEWVRGTFLAGGFGWFALGHTQAPYAPSHGGLMLIQIADLFGELAVSFVVAMSNGLIVDLVMHPRSRHESNPRTAFHRVLAATFLYVVVLVGSLVYGYDRINQAQQAAPQSLQITVVQTNVPQSNKLHSTTDQMLSDWQQLITLTSDSVKANRAAQLIVWPETVVPAALNPSSIQYLTKTLGSNVVDKYFSDEVRYLARALRVHLLVGAHAHFDWKTLPRPDGQPDEQVPARRYNSVYHYRPDGTQAPQRYDKVHRVPFGEYVPWVDSWPWLKRLFIKYLTPYDFDYTLAAGEAWTVFQVPIQVSRFQAVNPRRNQPSPTPDAEVAPVCKSGLARIAAPICFEDTVARVVRQMVYSPRGEKRADILVNLTNDGWYAGTNQGPQHFQIAVFRCIENRVPMARSVNTGISGFIDSVGRVGPLVEVDGHRQEVQGAASAKVSIDPRRTLYGRLGQAPIVFMAMVVAVMLWRAYPRRSPKPKAILINLEKPSD